MADITNLQVRIQIISDIRSEENQARKDESLRRFEIYRDRQKKFVLEAIADESSKRSASESRTFTSINLASRIINECASIYKHEPERLFSDASDGEKEQLDNLYKFANANVKLKKANKYYKLEDQCAIQVLPMNGVIVTRILLPHHYDVVPAENPEDAKVYIMNIHNKQEVLASTNTQSSFRKGLTEDRQSPIRDEVNQKTGDNDDYKALLERYVWWSDDFNFTTNGKGQVVDPDTKKASDLFDETANKNQLEELPFIDIAGEKDFEYWVRWGSSTTAFAIDFSVLLSDTAEINRLQGFSQAVISSVDVPSDVRVGPHSVIHLPIDPNADNAATKPEFDFVTPSPDMNASLKLLETYLRLFLTSKGMDPKTVSGSAETQRFSSGIERLLAMIEKFEASKDDLDLFRGVEWKLFDLMKKWSNLFQGATENQLIPELNVSVISDSVGFSIQFAEPEMIQTIAEKEDSAIKLIDAGLKSRKESIIDLRGVNESEAEKILIEIDSEGVQSPEPPEPPEEPDAEES